MNFQELYIKSKKEVKETLISMWTTGAVDDNGYEEALSQAIDGLFSPESTKPVVQSMFPWEPMDQKNWKELAGKLVNWDKAYKPYKHQYESWHKLLEDNKSICVTTGTGSGKTECFMLPVVKDIAEHPAAEGEGVQAIFLYPLNALAEDQRGRLNEILEQIDPEDKQAIRFAVYNGNTPENEGDVDQNAQHLSRELHSRSDIRQTPPQILITNPTMLEYIMLRWEDRPILGNNLRWFVIDETHSFKGAAAAELAMLIKRVISACGFEDSEAIRFATSSATTGTGENAEQELKKFIADISWKRPEDIEIVTGRRVVTGVTYCQDNGFPLTTEEQQGIVQSLIENDYISIDELIQKGNSNEEKLGYLDQLCDRVGVKAKVHYFFQAPSLGLNTKLNIKRGEMFEILNQRSAEDNDYPLVELVRCKKCGQLLARANVTSTEEEGIYEYSKIKVENVESFDVVLDSGELSDSDDVSDSDDLDEENGVDEKQQGKIALFAPARDGYGNCTVLPNSRIRVGDEDEHFPLVFGGDNRCPCCDKLVTKGKSHETNELHDNNESNRQDNLLPLSVGSLFISRILSRTFLEQTSSYEADTNQPLPHNGQQFISFIDNRQAAARLTLDQSLDVETEWVQSRVFRILSGQGHLTLEEKNELEEIKTRILEGTTDEKVLARYRDLIAKCDRNYLTWTELNDRLSHDYAEELNMLYAQFIPSKENEKASEEEKRTYYLMTILYEQLGSRKPGKDSLETLGMVHTYYPELEEQWNWGEIVNEYFEDFNENFPNKVSQEDWKNLVKLYIDYQIRSDASVFYREERNPYTNIDITSFRRFASRRDHRRPARPLAPTGRFARLLYTVAGIELDRATEEQKEIIERTLSQVLQLLKDKKFLTDKPPYRDRNGDWTKETREDTWRLNLTKIAFKVYDQAYFCPVTHRYIPYTFCGYSPYLEDRRIPREAKEVAQWESYEFNRETEDEVRAWWKEYRPDYPSLSLRSARLFLSRPIYVSAEHTAQISKELLKEHQDLFIAHRINVLTCSTTMEMGVDLGDLELVVMNSVPPHPANYKQRAGRSGRREQNKSVAVTICGNDSIGRQVMCDPLANLIGRVYSIPVVDFKSRQIIQRHVNSFLLRSMTGVELGDYVYEFFASGLTIAGDKKTNADLVFEGEVRKTPTFRLGNNAARADNTDNDKSGCNNADSADNADNDKSGCNKADRPASVCNRFMNQLRNNPTEEQKNSVGALLCGTPYEGREVEFIHGTAFALENTFEELQDKFEEIATEYDRALEEREDNFETLSSDKYLKRINYQYIGLLKTSLVPYLSTHQFTPNAAMPTSIVEFNTQPDKGKYDKNSNSSYTLSRALSQYAPGRLVILNNTCYRSAGVSWQSRFTDNRNGFETIVQYKNGEISIGGALDPVQDNENNETGPRRRYTMVTPTEFRTDISEEETRDKSTQIYTRTEAHLINTTAWQRANTSELVAVRGNVEGTTPEILFINTGHNGNGYCLCMSCGRAELETQSVNGPQLPPPPSFGEDHHNHISRENTTCDNNHLKRNVVFGDTIQTDYCEIKLSKYANDNHIKIDSLDPNNNEEDKKVLHTLGMLICDYLSKDVGIERVEIDYLLTTMGTLCIYDLAKGGAGYSSRLRDVNQLEKALDAIRNRLESETFTKDQLIDSFTLFNEVYIDLRATRRWLVDEYDSRKTVPEVVAKLDPNAATVCGFKVTLHNAIRERQVVVTLFADWDSLGDFQEFIKINTPWYKEANPNRVSTCFIKDPQNIVVLPPYEDLNRIEVHTSLKQLTRGDLPATNSVLNVLQGKEKRVGL
ncbi:DEAD/DEAH box helicase [uncultured Porphyromonas sp.]|uniref:DEAD/DEAH box helicase n=1 Tax=uncultured Porphyromonas sp. TaxID=159274 RepID=UPI0026018897|nr:DEAD/DEAH box helicase [uncultured Porphyromonas sp.]